MTVTCITTQTERRENLVWKSLQTENLQRKRRTGEEIKHLNISNIKDSNIRERHKLFNIPCSCLYGRNQANEVTAQLDAADHPHCQQHVNKCSWAHIQKHFQHFSFNEFLLDIIKKKKSSEVDGYRRRHWILMSSQGASAVLWGPPLLLQTSSSSSSPLVCTISHSSFLLLLQSGMTVAPPPSKFLIHWLESTKMSSHKHTRRAAFLLFCLPLFTASEQYYSICSSRWRYWCFDPLTFSRWSPDTLWDAVMCMTALKALLLSVCASIKGGGGVDHA